MIAVKLKHAGKSYDAHVDVEQPALAFKQTVHELTGVDPAKVKIPVKGGMLKVRRSSLVPAQLNSPRPG